MKRPYFLTALALLLTVVSCQEKEETVVKNDKFCLDKDIREKVTIDDAKMRAVSQTINLTGNITYNEDNIVQFVSLVEGVITNTYFSLGDYVKKGQVLAEIKSTELNSLQAEKSSVRSQLQVAERQLKVSKSMYDDGISSESDLVRAQSELDVLKSQYQNIESNLALFSASAEKSVFQIKAPSDGYIVKKNVSSGAQISSGGEPLFTISNLKEVWVMINIYATNMQSVEEGMTVDIKTPGYANETFTGKVSKISQVFDDEEHVLKARIVMQNTNLKLKPGMTVDIFIKNDSENQMTSLPSNSVIFDDNKNFLLVYKTDCEIEMRRISPTLKNEEWVYFENGLEEGERVITKNQLLIYEKLKEEM